MAGLLYHHGLKLSGERIMHPYRTYENKISFDALKNGQNPKLKDDFWKGPIGYFNEWCKYINPAEHLHIFVRRSPEEVAASLIKYGVLPRNASDIELITENVKIAYSWMDTVKYAYGGIDVYPHLLWRKDYANIKEVFQYCGLRFDETIADDFIEFR